MSIALGACSAAAAPAMTPSLPPLGSPPGTAAPNLPGGGTTGNPGSGGGVAPGDPNLVAPDPGQATLVVARPGQKNLHPVAPTTLQSSLDGRRVLVKITWYGGVEPCYVLDSVKVERSGSAIAVTAFEGSSDPTAACIELAMLKATIVDLGELEPGTYTISAPGSEAPPIQITVT